MMMRITCTFYILYIYFLDNDVDLENDLRSCES